MNKEIYINYIYINIYINSINGQQINEKTGSECTMHGTTQTHFHNIFFFSHIGLRKPKEPLRTVSKFFDTRVLVANLPPVSLIPVVHLYFQISPRIFEKI
jgi:hypothetical protein